MLKQINDLVTLPERSSVSKVDLPVKTSDDTCQAVKSRPATNHSGTVSVAARAAVFENAIVQSHGTLPPLRTVPTRPPLRQAFPMVGGASSTDGKLSMIPKIASTLSVVPDAAKMPSKPDAESREGAPSKTNVENNCRSSFASASKSAQLPENAFQKAMNVMGNSVELTLLAQVPVLHQHTTKKAGGIGDDISSSSPDAVLQEKLAGNAEPCQDDSASFPEAVLLEQQDLNEKHEGLGAHQSLLSSSESSLPLDPLSKSSSVGNNPEDSLPSAPDPVLQECHTFRKPTDIKSTSSAGSSLSTPESSMACLLGELVLRL